MTKSAVVLLLIAMVVLWTARPAVNKLSSFGHRRRLDQRRLQQNQVKRVGNDGWPRRRFPLGECEGDCDYDSDCEDGLVCFQRDGRESVPGCSGGSRVRSRTDYCVRPEEEDEEDDEEPPPILGGSFILKLYWKKGYFWQEEPFHRKWCMKCRGGRCRAGKQVHIVNCDDDDPTRFHFVEHDNNQIQIKVSDRDLCLHSQGGVDIYLRPCQERLKRQLWFASEGELSGGNRFQISPVQLPAKCITQRHHPKWGEVIRLEPIGTAKKGDTSYWNMY